MALCFAIVAITVIKINSKNDVEEIQRIIITENDLAYTALPTAEFTTIQNEFPILQDNPAKVQTMTINSNQISEQPIEEAEDMFELLLESEGKSASDGDETVDTTDDDWGPDLLD